MSSISFSTPSSSYYPFPKIHYPPYITIPTRISCVSNPTRINRKQTTDQSETQELVRLLTRKISDKEPLLKTLNKYVKLVRTEHCFLLFEELGKHDKWLQCLEVPFLSLYPSFQLLTINCVVFLLYSTFVTLHVLYFIFTVFFFIMSIQSLLVIQNNILLNNQFQRRFAG